MADDAREVALQHLFDDLGRSGKLALLLWSIDNQREAARRVLIHQLDTKPACTPAAVAEFAKQQGEIRGMTLIRNLFESMGAAARQP